MPIRRQAINQLSLYVLVVFVIVITDKARLPKICVSDLEDSETLFVSVSARE